jgi:hypothetical protein
MMALLFKYNLWTLCVKSGVYDNPLDLLELNLVEMLLVLNFLDDFWFHSKFQGYQKQRMQWNCFLEGTFHIIYGHCVLNQACMF